jgi:hypothetical protein
MTTVEIMIVVGGVVVLALNGVLAVALLRRDPRVSGIHWLFVSVTSVSAVLSLVSALS